MSTLLNNNLEIELKVLHPICHEMDILEHDPVTSFTSILKTLDSVLLLTLTHGNIDESTIAQYFLILFTDQFNFGCWIDTREEHKEGWSDFVHFTFAILNIKWFGFDIF